MPRDVAGAITGACDQNKNTKNFASAQMAGNIVGATKAKREINVDENIDKEWTKIMNMEGTTDLAYIICEYSEDDKGVNLQASGSGGIDEFVKHINPDKKAWGGIRCYAVDKRGDTTCKRVKFLFIQHLPKTLGALKKAKMGSHRGTMAEVIHGAHLDLLVEDVEEDLDKNELVKKLQAATGAHKPNGYEFNPDEITAAVGFTQT